MPLEDNHALETHNVILKKDSEVIILTKYSKYEKYEK